jgi:hypothetical protein
VSNPVVKNNHEDKAVSNLIIFTGLLAWLTGGAKVNTRNKLNSFDDYIDEAKQKTVG